MPSGRLYKELRNGVLERCRTDKFRNSQRLPRFHIPALGSVAQTEPGASEAEPGLKKEERRSQKQQNNF